MIASCIRIPLPSIGGDGGMTIPSLNGNQLPVGIHDCSFEELRKTFAYNPQRSELYRKIADYASLLRKYGVSGWILVDGSYVTAKNSPGDIDIIVVMERESLARQNPEDRCAMHYLFEPDVAIRFGLDSIPGTADGITEDGFVNETESVTDYLEIFTTVKYSEERKGILRIEL